MRYQDWVLQLQDRQLPQACIDLDAFDENVRQVASYVKKSGHATTVRVATKSIRAPELIQRVLDFGSPLKGLMTYSAEETRFLAQKGFDDFLLAYPTFQKKDLEALREVHESGKTVRAVVDSVAGIEILSQFLSGVRRPFSLVVDVDMSLRLWSGKIHLGVRRSPLRNAREVLDIFERARTFKNIRLVGLMGYEAQVAGLGDRNPFKKLLSPVFQGVRRLSMKYVRAFRSELIQKLDQAGHRIEFFNGGGTGDLNWALGESYLTEVTAGSAFLSSHLFDYYSNIRFKPAAFFALASSRSSDPQMVTCLGGGYIASGEPGWDKVPRVYLPEGARLIGTEGCGEVQTPVRLPPGLSLNVGDPILFRHAKAGELAERFNEYLLFQSGKITGQAQTYRGLGQCYF